MPMWPSGMHRMGLRDGVARIVVPPADPTPTSDMLPTVSVAPAAVYSLSRLVSGYSGALAFVTKSDNTGGKDIGVSPANDAFVSELPALIGYLFGFYDQSGNGNTAGSPNASDPTKWPRVRAETNFVSSRLAPSFGGVANLTSMVASLSAACNLTTNSRTEIFVIDPTCPTQNGVWSEHTDSGSTVYRDFYISGTAGSPGTVQAAQADTHRHIHTGSQVVVLVETPSGATIYIDGAAYPITGNSSTPTLAHVLLGASSFGAQFNANFRLGAYIAYAAPLNATEVGVITTALQNRFAIATDYSLNIVHIGDSIVEGVAATDGIDLIRQTRPLLGARSRWWNLGTAGKTMAQAYTDRAIHAGVLFVAGKTNLALIDTGINDLGNGTTAASLYNGTLTSIVALSVG